MEFASLLLAHGASVLEVSGSGDAPYQVIANNLESYHLYDKKSDLEAYVKRDPSGAIAKWKRYGTAAAAKSS